MTSPTQRSTNQRRAEEDHLQQGGQAGGSGTTDRDHGGTLSHQPAGEGSIANGAGASTQERRRFARRRDDPRP
ncbi:hypothetical protein [Ideonella sp. BN130291]|uniref:hypothetical protein n=1 Tax=Ideonella sp. BN130291 TaxID=3112940 RepID=UPI002E25FDC3|nr:hypothetical protein [Ideonella sp. BN130291]